MYIVLFYPNRTCALVCICASEWKWILNFSGCFLRWSCFIQCTSSLNLFKMVSRKTRRKSVVGKWCFWMSESPLGWTLFVSNVCVFIPSCTDGSADRCTETTTEATCLQVPSVCPASGTARAASSRCVSLWAVRNILTNRAALSTLQKPEVSCPSLTSGFSVRWGWGSEKPVKGQNMEKIKRRMGQRCSCLSVVLSCVFL